MSSTPHIFLRSLVVIAMVGVSLLLSGCDEKDPAHKEVAEIRITRQFGLGYLPLEVVQEKHLIEQIAKSRGLGDVKVTWVTLGNGAASTDALLSGSVDFTSMGVAPLITLWAKSGGQVKGLSALACAPMYLNTIRPAVHSVADFSDDDRIALPAAKVSIQAVVLQMAAAKAFGPANFARLDHLTVSMKHPDAAAALLSGKSEIAAHVTNDPFITQELQNPLVHEVFSSYDVVGGKHTHVLLAATTAFHDKNPLTCQVVLAAVEQAIAEINADNHGAAEIYRKVEESKEPLDNVVARLADRDLQFTATPVNVTRFSDFMFQAGTIKIRPNGWKDLFFPELHDKAGS